ncbi:MAG: PEP-CTERM sorting domain-containing protein [Planctomycetota bacterium]|nr:MAG: PEP-CTERM sorting domain-containing protein [Planctomycetota bacterium]
MHATRQLLPLPLVSKPSFLAATLVAIELLSCLSVWAQHDDVVPYSNGTQVLTGGHDDLANTTTQIENVFGYDFGETTENFASDPGFNNGSAFTTESFPSSGALPAGTLTFHVQSGLQYWNGAAGGTFVPAPTGLQIKLTKAANQILVSGSSAAESGGLPIGATASGRIHTHLESSIWGGLTAAYDPLTLGGPDGVYAFGATLSLPGSGLSPSDPIYFVFNQNLPESSHDSAIDYFTNGQTGALVPEPSTVILAILGLAVIGLTGLGRNGMARPYGQ